jgi:hypothetical protein
VDTEPHVLPLLPAHWLDRELDPVYSCTHWCATTVLKYVHCSYSIRNAYVS